MHKYKKLIVNSGIFTVANFGSRLINFLFVPLYTFWLTTEEYGAIDTILATISLLIPLISLSLADCVMRFVMEDFKKKKVLLSNAFITVFVIMGLFGLSYFPFQEIEIFSRYWIQFYLLLIMQTVNTIASQYVRGIGKVATFALNGVINTFFQIAFNIWFIAGLNWGIGGYLLGMNLSFIICNFYLGIKSDILKNISWKNFDFKYLKTMLRFSLPLVPTAMMWWVMNSADRYIILGVLGLSATGIYAVASKIPHIINMLFSIFQQAWQLSAIEESKAEDQTRFYSLIYNSLFEVLTIGTSFFLLFQKQFVQVFLEQSYHQAWRYIPFLFMAAIFSSLAGFLGTNYVVAQETKGAFKTALTAAVINLVLNAALTPFWGMYGTSFSTMLSFFILWIYRLRDTHKYVEIKHSIKSSIITLILLYTQLISVLMESRVRVGLLVLLVLILKSEISKFVVRYIITKTRR